MAVPGITRTNNLNAKRFGDKVEQQLMACKILAASILLFMTKTFFFFYDQEFENPLYHKPVLSRCELDYTL